LGGHRLNEINGRAFRRSAKRRRCQFVLDSRKAYNTGRIRFEGDGSCLPLPPKRTEIFHAHVIVTRIEEWCVEAATAEQARELLISGEGHLCHFGDRPAEVQNVLDD
jgi:hypothetical protein